MENSGSILRFDSPKEPTMEYSKVEPIIGRDSPKHPPHDPVSETDVYHWCQYMQDPNPLYTNREYAENSEHGSLLAPNAMVHVFCLGNMKASLEQFVEGKMEYPDDPNSRNNVIVEEEGYTGVMATAQRQTHYRRIKEGDEIYWTLQLSKFSNYDHLTRQGVGRKYTMLYKFTNQNDELICEQSFDVLVYRPPMDTRRLYAG